jgi:hypothetical protein
MQQKIWKSVTLITILVIVISSVVPVIRKNEQAVSLTETHPLEPATAEHILQTSIQITMFEYEYQKNESNEETVTTGKKESWQKSIKHTSGMGTLVSHLGETLLISHDHWSLFTSGKAPDKVEFHNTEGSLLHEMAGADLLPLILFHDSGTFILKAPETLAARAIATANMGLFETLNPGDIVHVVHHDNEQNDEISLLAAEIVSNEVYNGVPMLSLRSLNGQSIEPGDSGGGIWIDGHLAGNLWMTVVEVRQDWWRLNQPIRNETAFSLAAGLRVELIDLVETVLQVESPPSLETNGLS